MEVIEKEKFNIVRASEGRVLTAWKEEDGIEQYSAFPTMYCPKTRTLDDIREITSAEDAELTARRDEWWQNENNRIALEGRV